MLALQRMLEIKSYKTVWTMGHKIRQALATRDANYQLAGLIEMDDTYFGCSQTRQTWTWRRRQGQGGGSRGNPGR